MKTLRIHNDPDEPLFYTVEFYDSDILAGRVDYEAEDANQYKLMCEDMCNWTVGLYVEFM